MKALIVAVVVGLFLVPGAVALWLIVRFLAERTPDLYHVLTWLGVAFATLTMMWGPLWFLPSSASSELSSRSHHERTSQQEMNHDKSYHIEVGS